MSSELMSALLGAVVGAIIGGVLTWAGTALQARSEKAARREKIATALLWELRAAERGIHLAATNVDNLSSKIRVPLFERIDPDVMLLSHTTVGMVLDFRGRLEEIAGLRERARDVLPNRRRHRIRVKLVSAAEAVGPLARALEQDGAITPPKESGRLVKDWPPLPARTFEYGPPLPADEEPMFWKEGVEKMLPNAGPSSDLEQTD
jgi:hypothetical protein